MAGGRKVVWSLKEVTKSTKYGFRVLGGKRGISCAKVHFIPLCFVFSFFFVLFCFSQESYLIGLKTSACHTTD